LLKVLILPLQQSRAELTWNHAVGAALEVLTLLDERSTFKAPLLKCAANAVVRSSSLISGIKHKYRVKSSSL